MPVLFAGEIGLNSSMNKALQGLAAIAMAGVFALALFAGRALARETDPASFQLGFTGRYLLILEHRHRQGFRIKTLDPLTLEKKVVYTAPRSVDYIENLTGAAGRIAFYIVRERPIRYRGKRVGTTTQTLITMKDDGGSQIVLKRFRSLGGWHKSCGSHPGKMFIASDGAHYLVESVAGKLAANGKRCARTANEASRRANLLRFADPFSAPTSRPMEPRTNISTPAPDGGGYAFQNRSSISYYDMITGAKQVISPDRGFDFEEHVLGPGRRMIATAREDSDDEKLHVYFFPDVSNPSQRFELTGIDSEELSGRFCGDRPLVVDASRARYLLFDQQGREIQVAYTGAADTSSIAVACTGSNLLLAVDTFNRRKSRRWVFAPLVP